MILSNVFFFLSLISQPQRSAISTQTEFKLYSDHNGSIFTCIVIVYYVIWKIPTLLTEHDVSIRKNIYLLSSFSLLFDKYPKEFHLNDFHSPTLRTVGEKPICDKYKHDFISEFKACLLYDNVSQLCLFVPSLLNVLNVILFFLRFDMFLVSFYLLSLLYRRWRSSRNQDSLWIIFHLGPFNSTVVVTLVHAVFFVTRAWTCLFYFML